MTGCEAPLPLIPEAMRSILDDQATHLLLGRISVGAVPGRGDSAMVSYCSCGLAFYGVSIADADNRQAVHHAVATGERMTSWRAEP